MYYYDVDAETHIICESEARMSSHIMSRRIIMGTNHNKFCRRVFSL